MASTSWALRLIATQQSPQPVEHDDRVFDIAGSPACLYTQHPGAQRVGEICRRRRRQFPGVGGALQRRGQSPAQPLHVPLGQGLDARVAVDRRADISPDAATRESGLHFEAGPVRRAGQEPVTP